MQTQQAFRPLRTRTPRVTKFADVPATSTWSAPSTVDFASVTQELYFKACLAVELYVKHADESQIKQRTGYSLSRARKLTERCLRINPQTQAMTGFWACIPGRRLPGEAHQRTAPFKTELSDQGQGLKGALKQLFRERPRIESDMTHLIRYRCLPGQPKFSILGFKIVVSAFHVLCRREGVREDQWPFNRKGLGKNAIYEWWVKKRAQFPMETIENQYGDEAVKAAKLGVSMICSTRPSMVPMAYQRLEMDEHLMHGIFNIGIPNRKGGITWVSCRRFWVLAIRDKRSGAVLATGLSYREKYNSNDVITLIRKALLPPPRRILSIVHPEFRYTEDAAYPAELVEFKRNTWMELAWDGDKCHLSLAAKRRVEEVVGCHVKFEKIGTPAEREAIEAYFKDFAPQIESLPVGTGSHPLDPARRDPEGAARVLNLYAHHAEEIADVYARNHNSKPSTRCGGASPLQFMKELNLKGEAFISPLGELGPDNAYKLLPNFPAKLTKRYGSYGPLRACLLGASYSSAALAFEPRLSYVADTAVQVYVEDDARNAFIVPDAHPDTNYPVMVIDKDLRGFAHSIEWRSLAEAATANAVSKGDAVSPSLMMGVVGYLGTATQQNVPNADAQLAGIGGFMATAGSLALGYVMTPEQQAMLLAEVDELSQEPGDVPETPAAAQASTPEASPRDAVAVPDMTHKRLELPSNSFDDSDPF